MSRELEVRLVKEEMQMLIQEGQLTKFDIVEITLRKLVSMNVPFLNQAYLDWEKEKKEIETQGMVLDKKLNELIDKYYNSIMKLENADGPPKQ